MKKSITILTSVLVIALVSTHAFAWGHGKNRNGDGPGKRCQAVMSSLTQEQQDQVKALRQEFIDQTYALRVAKMTQKATLKMLMETSSPDRAELIKLSDELLTLDKQLRDKRIDYMLKAKEIAPELALMGFGGKGGFGGRHGGCGQGRL